MYLPVSHVIGGLFKENEMARKKRTTKRSKCGVANKVPASKKPVPYIKKLFGQLKNIISFLFTKPITWHVIYFILNKI